MDIDHLVGQIPGQRKKAHQNIDHRSYYCNFPKQLSRVSLEKVPNIWIIPKIMDYVGQ